MSKLLFKIDYELLSKTNNTKYKWAIIIRNKDSSLDRIPLDKKYTHKEIINNLLNNGINEEIVQLDKVSL